jgi:hypothetical protein
LILQILKYVALGVSIAFPVLIAFTLLSGRRRRAGERTGERSRRE